MCWRVPQNVQRSLPSTTHIQLRLDHTSVWYLQGVGGASRELKFYPSVEDIFGDLTRQSNTKLDIPPIANKVDQPIVEPLTDQEKEEDYETNSYQYFHFG